MQSEYTRDEVHLIGLLGALSGMLSRAFPMSDEFSAWEGAAIAERTIGGINKLAIKPNGWEPGAGIRCYFAAPANDVARNLKVHLTIPTRNIEMDFDAVMCGDGEVHFWKSDHEKLTEDDFRRCAEVPSRF